MEPLPGPKAALKTKITKKMWVGGMGQATKCAAAGLSHAFNGVSDHPRCAQDAMQD